MPGCPICTNSYSTTRICSRCKTEPWNVGWGEPSSREVSLPDPDGQCHLRHSDRLDKRLRPATPKQKQILELLSWGRINVPRRKRIMRQRKFQWVTVRVERALSAREIAKIVQCDEKYVRKVYKAVLV